ncbi:argonaute 2 [Dermatophagoides farinae]|uniref:Argonaute 2 n=1 Tax=Dermatophagoides farinae TaxID=6954 RepID=A0A9D4P2Y0_DERFA|nr:argonaute 2 [Dermatophagoides farinae]
MANYKDQIYLAQKYVVIIADQKARKLTIKEKADLIRKAASINPIDRLDEVRNSVEELINIDNNENYLKEFGFNISTQPITIRARVLDSPKLLEGDDRPIKLTNGKWRYRKFFQPIALKRWILVKLMHFDDSTVEKFLDTFIRNGEQLGMQIDMPIRMDYDFDIATLANFLQKLQHTYSSGSGSEQQLQLLFFIGCNTEWQHSAIKKCGDVDFGLVTQCIRQTNVQRINQSIAVNILHKINAKLGGINVTLDYGKLLQADDYRKTMAIGVDVAHPSPSEKNLPSIAAMVANVDESFARYTSSVKIQKFFRQEIIQELDKMLIDLLRAYEMETNQLPERIILYRDGVSEGQFQVVFNEEILLIKETLARYRSGHKFRLTFVIVQKRHHSRFIPDNSKDGVGRFYNIPPGTVVDTDVVHPRRFDFYLCSHAGIQGTSRPSHYCLLVDENEMSADHIQNFTNVLCHLYARCSRSISIPTPVFYAHLAAFRAREHIQAATSLMMLSMTNNHNFDSFVEMSPTMRSSMYFC